SPLLSEIYLSGSSSNEAVGPIIAALEGRKRLQALKLELDSNGAKVVADFEEHSGRISVFELQIERDRDTGLLDHPLLRNIYFHRPQDLPSVLARLQRCLRNNNGLESIKIDCQPKDFIGWMESIRELFAKYPQQKPQFFLSNDKATSSTDNIQDPSATEIDLESINTMTISAGSNPSIFPAPLKALEKCVELQNVDVQFHISGFGIGHLSASPSSQDSVKRIRLQTLSIRYFGGQPTEQILSWILSIVKRNNTIEPHRIDTDSNNANTSGDSFTTASPLSPSRLREVNFFFTKLMKEQWIQIIQSIDVLTLQTFSIEDCSKFTEVHLSALVDRCITTAAEALASRQSPTSSSDPWALQDLQSRALQHFRIDISETAIEDEHIERETERLKSHNIGWVSIERTT
ncbi:hypothetical protein BGX29_000424, partial [Mortierella sp. GBA35]